MKTLVEVPAHVHDEEKEQYDADRDSQRDADADHEQHPCNNRTTSTLDRVLGIASNAH